jgi:hypothetical protein
MYEEGDTKFTDICELCNHIGLRRNFEIYNTNTNKYFLVGRNCIKRFIILAGAETLEDSSVLFEMKSEELIAIKVLQNLVPAILETPKPQELMKFRKYAEKLVGGSQQNMTRAKWDTFLTNLYAGKMPPKEHIDRIRTALYNPRAIRVQKVKLSTAAEQRKIGSWANTSKIKTRADNTLARSDIYRNPQKEAKP